MKSLSPSLVICLAFLGSVAAQGGPASLARAAAADGYVWWFINDLPARQADGGLAVVCFLNLPVGARVTSEPKVFYTTSEFKPGRRMENQPRGDRELIQKFYRKTVERLDGQYAVTVYSGGTKSFALRAELELDGRPCYAQTMFTLNGSSGRPDPGAVEIESEPAGPRLALAVPNPGRFRTEDTAALSLSAPPGLRPELVSVYDQEGRILARPPLTDDGQFYYTPPFDRKLASGGYRGRNHLVFVARLPQGLGVATYYLQVQRNFQGGRQSLPAGLAVAAVTALICLLLVQRARKRFKYQ